MFCPVRQRRCDPRAWNLLDNNMHGFEEPTFFLQTFLHKNFTFECCAATFLKNCEECWFKSWRATLQTEQHTYYQWPGNKSEGWQRSKDLKTNIIWNKTHTMTNTSGTISHEFINSCILKNPKQTIHIKPRN